ncbi:MAG: hypothetical protein A4E42_01521 [Methanoregulaceae archaeon PtaU1.Bin222]|nr:MAG: hypothetical protein A4E42_01521 [Methanoregulaceae archaeon PtaU1.Bin222]
MLMSVTMHHHIIPASSETFSKKGAVMAVKKRKSLAIHEKFGE